MRQLAADPDSHRWMWIESLPVPALVFRLSDRLTVFANTLSLQLLGAPRGLVEGRPVSSLLPAHCLPRIADVRRWAVANSQDSSGSRSAEPVEVEVTVPHGSPLRLVAHMGPADPATRFVLVCLSPLPAPALGVPGALQGENPHGPPGGIVTRLREQLEADALERDVLTGVGRITSSPIHFSTALAGIATELSRALPATRIAIHEVSPKSQSLCLAHEWPSPGTAGSVESVDADPRVSAAREKCLTEQQPVIAECAAGGDARPLAAVVAPLLLGNRSLGTMTVFVHDKALLSARAVALAGRLADQVAGAVHTTRTYQDKQRETELRRTLAAVGLAASQDLALNRVLERVADEIAELVRYDLMAVAIAEPDRSLLRVRYQVGAEIRISAYDANAGAVGVLQLRPTARTVDLRAGQPGFGELATAGFQSLLEVSLGSHEDAAIGYIALVSKNRNAFSQPDLELMRRLAVQVTPAVQNALAHEQSVALAEARTAEAKAEARSLELERINDAKSRFLGVVSHELRTPLTSIIAYAELLSRNLEGNLTEKQATHAAIINESARHLKFLISDLLDVSRIESGNLSLEITRFDLRSLVKEVAERLRPVLVEKSQELETHVARRALEIDGDRPRIAQVISNILENASKYSPRDTVITLDVHRRKDEVLITVTDRGIGISAEDQQQLFTPFFRANSALTRTEPGTGLGLSLVKKITELHGGKVSVTSKPGEGSAFTVALGTAKVARAA